MYQKNSLLSGNSGGRINDKPGIVIYQDRYVSKKAASMLPTQPVYAETQYKLELPERNPKKLKAWLVNADVSQIVAERLEANNAK